MSREAVARELLLGDSQPMQELRRLVVKFAPTSLPVLIAGPTGSGKGVVARALHVASGRSGRYVVTNMAAFGEGLLESELFGHVRGAFTSSTGTRRGLLQMAHGGTAFLDEVHRLSASAQPKLLRVLETGLLRPVGSDDEVRSDFRVVSAANENLEMLVDAGRFQGDLLARLSRLVIHVPPLVDHLDDVPLLAHRFVQGLVGVRSVCITNSAMDALMEHDWPRNVRELQAVVERAAILAEGSWIDRTEVREAIAAGVRRPDMDRSDPRRASLAIPERPDRIARRERKLLEALEKSQGRVRLAAVQLGVSKKTVYRWLRELNIDPPERRRPRSMPPSSSIQRRPPVVEECKVAP